MFFYLFDSANHFYIPFSVFPSPYLLLNLSIFIYLCIVYTKTCVSGVLKLPISTEEKITLKK